MVVRPARSIVEVVEVAMQEYSAWRARVEKRRLAAWRLIAAGFVRGRWRRLKVSPRGRVVSRRMIGRNKHGRRLPPFSSVLQHSVAERAWRMTGNSPQGIGGLQRAAFAPGTGMKEVKAVFATSEVCLPQGFSVRDPPTLILQLRQRNLPQCSLARAEGCLKRADWSMHLQCDV